MSSIKFHKVVGSLPGTLEANSVYFVRVGLGFSIHLTNDIGQVTSYDLNTSSEVVELSAFYEFLFTGDNPSKINKWQDNTKTTLIKEIDFVWGIYGPTSITITDNLDNSTTVFTFSWDSEGVISSIDKIRS